MFNRWILKENDNNSGKISLKTVKKPFVLIPVFNFLPVYAGWIKQTITLIERLPEVNFLVCTNLVEGTLKEETLLSNLHVVRKKNLFAGYNFLSKTFFSIQVVLFIIKNFKNIQSIYFPFSYYPAEILIILSSIFRKKTICRLSGGELGEYEKSISTKIRIYAYKKADYIVVLNSMQKKYLLKKGVSESRIKLIPNAIDISTYESHGEFNIDVKEKLHKDKITIGFVGYITKRKGLLNLLEALDVLAEDLKNKVQLLIIGPFDQIDGEEDYFKKINLFIERSEFPIIITGRVNSIEPLFSSMHIYVLPSLFEGMPNSLLEAMASGVASIGSKIPGILDIIDTDKNGLLFKASDVLDLSDKLRYLIENEEKRNEFAKKGQATIKRFHNLNSTKLSYEKLFTIK